MSNVSGTSRRVVRTLAHRNIDWYVTTHSLQLILWRNGIRWKHVNNGDCRVVVSVDY